MPTHEVIPLSPVNRIALVGILSAFNIGSRLVLQFLPNVKPVTSLIIISVMLFGVTFGLELTFVTTVVSGIFLGLGPWTLFQIFAWAIICFLTECLCRLFAMIKKKPPLLFMACFSFIMGYVFGLFVSFEKLVEGGYGLFLPYYLSGLSFDTYHAFGNFFFMMMLMPVMRKIFASQIKLHQINF